MVPEPDSQPSLNDFPDRLLDRFSGLFIDDVKDLFDLLSSRIGQRPSGQLLGDLQNMMAKPRDVFIAQDTPYRLLRLQ